MSLGILCGHALYLPVFHKLEQLFILGNRDIIKFVLWYVDIGHILLAPEQEV